MNNKKRLFVDMDGTLAKFSFVSNEKLHERGYFENLEPIESVVAAVKEIIKEDNGIEVFTMSAVLTDSEFAVPEKNTWLDKNIPEIDADHRVFVPCGENKKDYLPNGIQEQDYLLDDFTENLNAWLPNMGIKILNGINNTKDTWEGNKISFEKNPLQLAKDIVAVMDGKKVIKDIAPLNYEGLKKEEWEDFLEKDEHNNKYRQGLLKSVKKYLNQGYEKKTVEYLAGCEAQNVRFDETSVNNKLSLEEVMNAVNKGIEEQQSTLSKEQEEFFKDSVVRDKNGNLIKMYHGTPFSDFNEFRSGTHFSANKEYAKRYENVGASSSGISAKKLMNGAELNPVTYETYLNIKKPFSLDNEECLDIYIHEYIKGGYAQGINPYLDDEEYEKMLAENPVIDWMEAENLQEFLEENEYDYDGLIVDEGGDGGYENDVQQRGKAYVIFSPSQAKLTSDKKPLNINEFNNTENKETMEEKVDTKNNEKTIYRYYVTQRPIDIGTIPKAKESTNITAFESKRDVAEIGRSAYGYVEYDKPLSSKEISSYELLDANTVQIKAEKGQGQIENLSDVGIRSTHGEEKFVYIVRRESNGQYHVGWTENLTKTLNEMPDKGKVMGCFIVPNHLAATSFKKFLNKQSHLSVNTFLLYPDRLQRYYEKAENIEFVDVAAINEVLKLDTGAIVREFPFMHSEVDMVNEIYNNVVDKMAKKLKEYMSEEIEMEDKVAKELADKNLADRVEIIEKALENNFSMKEIETLMTIDISNSDCMKYSKEQMEHIIRDGVDNIIYDDFENPRIIPKGAFDDIKKSIPQNAQVRYFKDGLFGRYFMQVTKENGKVDLYTISNLPLFSETQTVLADLEPEQIQMIVKKFNALEENIDDVALAEKIADFTNINKENILKLLEKAEASELNQIIDGATRTDEESRIVGNQLKEMVQYNIKNFGKKNLEQYINEVKENKNLVRRLPKYIEEDIVSLRKLTKEVDGILEHLPEIAKNDLECVINQVEKRGMDYVFASADLRDNESAIKAALKNDRGIAAYISKEKLEKISTKSLIDAKNLNVRELSIERCLNIYGFVEDDVSIEPISKYFKIHPEKKDAMFDAAEEKWNGEDSVLIKEEKTAILKLKRTDENKDRMGLSFQDLLLQRGEMPDLNNYEIVYIDNTYISSSNGIQGLFQKINGEEKPTNFYETGMEMGDIVITTKNGFDFEMYYVDMENSIRPAELIDPHTKRKINDNIDVRVETELLKRFKEEGALGEIYTERLNELEKLYSDLITGAQDRTGEVKEETDIELTPEEKDGLRKTDIAETRQNILPKDRMTYKKEDGEVILKKGAVENKEEFQRRTEELYQKEETIKNISTTYAIESSEDYPRMLQEYDADEIKKGINYRIVQIDRVSGMIVKVNEILFSSREIAEHFFEQEYYNPSISKATGKGKNVLVSYDAFVYKALEVASIRKDNELLQGIQNVLDSDKFKGWCTARANQFHKKYSLNNSLSIFMQNENASIVYGARQWQELGRQVKKGEKALRITVPSKYAYQRENGGLMRTIKRSIEEQIKSGKEFGIYRLGESNLTFVGSRNGLYSMLVNNQVLLSNIDEMSLSRYIDTKVIGKLPVTYTSVNVFDISQVEEPEYLSIRNLKEEDKVDLMKDRNGNPLKTRNGAFKVANTPERRAKLNPVLDMQIQDVEEVNVEEIYKSLKIISERDGVPVEEKNLPDGVNGFFNREENCIAVDEGLSATHKVKTCIHEIAHSRMHKNGANLPRRLKEVQAEAVSYIVNKSLGIDTDNFSFNYIANWTGSRRMSEIKQSLDIINDEAASLYEDIQKDLSERGVNLKLKVKEIDQSREEIKRSVPEIEKKLEKEKNENLEFVADLLELQTKIQMQADETKEQLEKEKDQGLIEMLVENYNSYNSMLYECSSMNEIATQVRGELNQEMPDFEKIQKFKSALDKSMERFRLLQEETHVLKKHMQEYTKALHKGENQDVGKSEFEQFRLDFEEDSVKALKSIFKEYPMLKDLSKAQAQYLASSAYIRETLKELAPESSISNFVALCMAQIQNVEHVKSDSNVFVEIVDSEYSDLQKGSVMHMKVADKQINTIENGMRKTREDALRRKELVPAVEVVVDVYTQTEKGNLARLSDLNLKLGNKKQDGLISAIENRTKGYPKYQKFVNDCKDACKEMDVFKKKKTQPIPEISQIIKQSNLLQDKMVREQHQREQEKRRKEEREGEKDNELPEVEAHNIGLALDQEISFGHVMQQERTQMQIANEGAER